MNPPVLVPCATLASGAPRRFLVERAGWFEQRWWRVGERVLCGAVAHVGEVVVLVPSGRGAPRLGKIRRLGLEGDRGEACDPRRWAVAGRVLGVEPAEPAVVERPQLSLFSSLSGA